MFVLVRMQLRNHVDTQPVPFPALHVLCDIYIYIYIYICDIKFGMLQVRSNEISLRKWCGGAAQLRSLRGNTAEEIFTKQQEICFNS